MILSSELEAVRFRSEGIVAAEIAQDVDKALSFYTEDAVVQPPAAPQVQGKAAIGKLYREFGFGTGKIKEFEGIQTHLEVSTGGDLAFEYGINRMLLGGPEGNLLDVGKYLCVWKKVRGEWCVTALSFTSDSPAPVGSGNQKIVGV